MASPSVKFNLRSMVGARRNATSEAASDSAEQGRPADAADNAPPVQREETKPPPVNRGFTFSPAEETIHNFYSSGGATGTTASPPLTTDDVHRRFEELKARTPLASHVAPQILRSDDFIPSRKDASRPPVPLSTQPGASRSSLFVYSQPSALVNSARRVSQHPEIDERAYAPLREPVEESNTDRDRDDDDTATDYPEYPMSTEDGPLVPVELLRRSEVTRYDWQRHPAHPFVLNLLEHHGVSPSMHPALVEYHMAAAFLKCLSVCAAGSYFIKYGHRGTVPKERFISLRILPSADATRFETYVVITVHQDGVQLLDRIRLQDLVGVTTGVINNPAFTRHLVQSNVIKGGHIGQHRARLSTKGAFTLWFYDRKTRKPKALSLLTTHVGTLQVWTLCMKGILGVNSVSVTRSSTQAADMDKYFQFAQNVINADGYESN